MDSLLATSPAELMATLPPFQAHKTLSKLAEGESSAILQAESDSAKGREKEEYFLPSCWL